MELKRKVINHDWVNNKTCRLSHFIHIISNLYVKYDNFSDLIRKISPIYSVFVSPARQKRDIGTAFPASSAALAA